MSVEQDAGQGGARPATGARRRTVLSVLLRALAVQGSWNYETLGGTGFAFVILPELRRIHGDRGPAVDAALRRHEGPFNSHPYLAPLAIGAVIRMEEDEEDPAVIDRFKAALRGSLGTLGDQLVWAGWRPVCLLGALMLFLLGLPWWIALLGFLLVYNAGHIAMMYWGLSVGLAEGRGVAERLRGSVRTTQPRLTAAGAFLAGAVMVLVAADGVPGLAFDSDWVWAAAAVMAVAAGARWGERVRPFAIGGTLALAVAGVIAGVLA